jgi:hypothetical protein
LAISVVGGNADNYALPATADLTITPSSLPVTGVTVASKVYDGTHVASLSGGTISPFNNDLVALVKTAATGTFDTVSAGVGKNVMVTGYALSGNEAGNYIVVQPTGLVADIIPKQLTITANNDNKTYDSVPYGGGRGVTYSGWIKGETESVLGGSLSYGGTSQGAVSVGTYSILPRGLTAKNYDMVYREGLLTIAVVTPSALLINPVASSVVTTTSKPESLSVSALPNSIKVRESPTAPGIRLTIESPPQGSEAGVATLVVNQLPAPGKTLLIPMPRELSGVGETTVSSSSLPMWLSFDPVRQVFSAQFVPPGVETIQVNVQINGRFWRLTLDFRNS